MEPFRTLVQYACPIIDGPKIWKPKTHRWSPICWEGLAKAIIDGREHPKLLHPLSVCWAHQYINSIPSPLPLPTVGLGHADGTPCEELAVSVCDIPKLCPTSCPIIVAIAPIDDVLRATVMPSDLAVLHIAETPLPTELVRCAMDEAKRAVDKYIDSTSAINPHPL